MALGGGVHLLLEHPLVDRANGPLRPAVHSAAELRGGAKGVLRHRAAVRAPDGLRPVRDLVAIRRFAPLLGPIGVADGHAAHDDGVVDAANGRHAGDAPPRPQDHRPVDRLADDPVGATDVVGALRRNGRRLQPQAGAAHLIRRLLADRVSGPAPVLQREIKSDELDLETENAWIQHSQRLPQELLAGLIALQRHYLECRHRRARVLLRELWPTGRARGVGRASSQTTDFACTSLPVTDGPPSAGSSTWSRGLSRARTGRRASSTRHRRTRARAGPARTAAAN